MVRIAYTLWMSTVTLLAVCPSVASSYVHTPIGTPVPTHNTIDIQREYDDAYSAWGEDMGAMDSHLHAPTSEHWYAVED